MAEKIKYLDETIPEILGKASSKLKKLIETSIDYTFTDKDIGYVAAYQRLLSSLGERVVNNKISQSKLEKLTAQLKTKEPRKARVTKEKELTYEQFCEERKTKTYTELKEEYPGQDLRRYEGAYNRFELKKEKVEAKKVKRIEKHAVRKGGKEITGLEYRKLFTETFHTEDPRTVDKEDIKRFDNEIKEIYHVPHGNATLRAYRARFHPSW